MLIAHKIALAPHNKQATHFARAAGTARFAHNWALAEWQKQYADYQADKRLPQSNQYALRRQLTYKAALCGGGVLVVDRFFASSKLCPACGARHDQDMNVALNLKNLTVSSTASACGEAGSGLERKPQTKPASVKREVNDRFVQK